MPPRLPLPQSTLQQIPEYQRSEAYLHGIPQEDAAYRAKEKRKFDRLKDEARQFALNTAENPSTQRRKLQKRLITDFPNLFYEGSKGTVRRNAVPSDSPSDRGGVAIPLPSITPVADTDESFVSHPPCQSYFES